MNLNAPPTPRLHPTRGSVASPAGGTCRPPSSGRTRLVSWLIVPTLLVLTAFGTSTATAARSARPRPTSCRNGTGARWHIRHFFYQYDKHGALTGGRLPASGDRYTVSAGGAGFYVPPGEGLLYGEDVPQGFVCAASLDQTHTPYENGDNRHNGFCVTKSHKFAFIWTAATPSPYKLKPR